MVPAERLSALDKSEINQDLTNLYDGLKMTESVLMQTLKKHGLERFDPSVEGEKFNPNEHEATFMTPIEGKEDGTVFHTQLKGFRLNNRVIRAAKVGVVKN
jgi:molecular chaperone GrpE